MCFPCSQRITVHESFPGWIAASNAGNGIDWLWIGIGKDGEDLPLNFSSWGDNEPRHEGETKGSRE